jgi:hypothetical protein
VVSVLPPRTPGDRRPAGIPSYVIQGDGLSAAISIINNAVCFPGLPAVGCSWLVKPRRQATKGLI